MTNDCADGLMGFLLNGIRVDDGAHCMDDNEIAAYVDRTLLPVELDRAEMHLVCCRKCRELCNEVTAAGEVGRCLGLGAAAAWLGGRMDAEAGAEYRSHLAACPACTGEVTFLQSQPQVLRTVVSMLDLAPRLRAMGAAQAVLAVVAAVEARRIALSARAARSVHRAADDFLGRCAVREGLFTWDADEADDADTYQVTLLRDEQPVWTTRTHQARCMLSAVVAGRSDPVPDVEYGLEIASMRMGRPTGRVRRAEIHWLSAAEAELVARKVEACAPLEGSHQGWALVAVFEAHGLLHEALDACEEVASGLGEDFSVLVTRGRLLEAMGLYPQASAAYRRCTEAMASRSEDEA